MSHPTEERARRLPFAFTRPRPGGAPRRRVSRRDRHRAELRHPLPARQRDPKTAVYLMHPRGEFTRHYVVPPLTARGYAVFGHNSRYLNNDTDMVHERLLFDIAAGMRSPEGRRVRAHRPARKQRWRFAARLLPVAGFTRARRPARARPRAASAIDLDAGGRCPKATSTSPSPPTSAKGGSCSTSSTRAWSMSTTRRQPTPSGTCTTRRTATSRSPQPSTYDPDWLADYRERQRERIQRLDAIARIHRGAR